MSSLETEVQHLNVSIISKQNSNSGKLWFSKPLKNKSVCFQEDSLKKSRINQNLSSRLRNSHRLRSLNKFPTWERLGDYLIFHNNVRNLRFNLNSLS